MRKITLQVIQKKYTENDICMSELLASIPADGLTIEEAFELYMQAMKWSDGDRFFTIADGEKIEL